MKIYILGKDDKKKYMNPNSLRNEEPIAMLKLEAGQPFPLDRLSETDNGVRGEICKRSRKFGWVSGTDALPENACLVSLNKFQNVLENMCPIVTTDDPEPLNDIEEYERMDKFQLQKDVKLAKELYNNYKSEHETN